MTPAAAFGIYAAATLALALASAVYDGWRGYDDPAGGIFIAVMWPLFAVVALVIGPFWIAYKVGGLAFQIAQSLSPNEASAGNAGLDDQ